MFECFVLCASLQGFHFLALEEMPVLAGGPSHGCRDRELETDGAGVTGMVETNRDDEPWQTAGLH